MRSLDMQDRRWHRKHSSRWTFSRCRSWRKVPSSRTSPGTARRPAPPRPAQLPNLRATAPLKIRSEPLSTIRPRATSRRAPQPRKAIHQFLRSNSVFDTYYYISIWLSNLICIFPPNTPVIRRFENFRYSEVPVQMPAIEEKPAGGLVSQSVVPDFNQTAPYQSTLTERFIQAEVRQLFEIVTKIFFLFQSFLSLYTWMRTSWAMPRGSRLWHCSRSLAWSWETTTTSTRATTDSPVTLRSRWRRVTRPFCHRAAMAATSRPPAARTR